ncbi:hypothetical protein K504DRAFT_475654 [Pleomassaria siparia CBS 279.74]|uniref:Uncharacterized protein n=1 Tax=Pleomassaria siparia CBS 279.74 TaxID=1314801 RepID=A0A6G1KE15_9PLEO|nr:hypothetical protein K504DRAFT_475654 [Pleomassaria siparia CBS 279.74]
MEPTNSSRNWPFYVLAGLGTYCTWGRALLDGSLRHLFIALHGPELYVLPGTRHHLQTSFTGVYWLINYFLDMLVIFFWEAIDGSHPATSVIGTYFLGQYLSILTVIYVDSLRTGNTAKATLWLTVFQITAIGSTGAIWAIVYISTSPLARDTISLHELHTASLTPPDNVVTIIPSLAIGYICTAIVMAFPSPRFILFSALTSRAFKSTKPLKSHLSAVRFVYTVSGTISAVIHIAVVLTSLLTILFLMVFSPTYLSELSPWSLAIPLIFFTEGRTVGDGVVGLVMLRQYRCTYIATGTRFRWQKEVLRAAIVSVVGGPGVACLSLSWRRDEILFGGEGEVEERKRK